MRCLSCNVILSDKESTRRGALSNEFIDLCDSCLSNTEIETYTNPRWEENEFLEDQEG